MKVNAVRNYTLTNNAPDKNSKNVNFGSFMGGVLSASGVTMQWLERCGYMGSFLIQDGLGMTAPRVWTGINSDRDITGEYNLQEGWEVFGREGSTGPFMMVVAPILFFLSSLLCKSTNTNTQLIKRLGKNLKNIVSSKNFNTEIKENSEKFKDYFYRYNIERIYKDTVKKDKNQSETIEFIVNQLKSADTKDKKGKKEIYNQISAKINEKLMESSTDLYNLDSVFVGEGSDKKAFDTVETMKAISAYAEDAIVNNKNFASIDADAAENIKNNFATKRVFMNFANVAAVLGGLAVLPKLYIRSNVSPGAKTLEITKQKQAEERNKSLQTEDNIAFKGRGIGEKGLFEKIGKFITKYTPDKVHELLEYVGYNFTHTTFACLAIFGLIFPRGKRAWDRAQIDKNGKRDMTEIQEILYRDTISSLSVVFAVPLLTKAFLNFYENGTGYILTNKASRGKNWFKKTLDIINPYSKLNVLSLSQLDSIYGHVDTKEKLMNFAKFVEKNDGDLAKILSNSKNAELIFNNKTESLESMKHLSRGEKNKKIISILEKLDSGKNELIQKLMKDTIKNKSSIAEMARNLNSFPKFISTWIISPVILGYLIPEFTYHMTRKSHAKQLEGYNREQSA